MHCLYFYFKLDYKEQFHKNKEQKELEKLRKYVMHDLQE